MIKKGKKTEHLPTYNLTDFEKQLRTKKLELPLAWIAMRARYSAAVVGVFDFPADAEFYRLNIYAAKGNDVKARKIVLERVLAVKAKRGKILYGEDAMRAEKVYRAAYQKWIKTAEAKRHPKYKQIKLQMGHYEDSIRITKTPFDTEVRGETPFDEPKPRVKKVMKRT